MHGSILPVTIPPGHTLGGFAIFISLGGLFPTPEHAEREFPTPGTPRRPQIRCLYVHNIDDDTDFRTVAKPDVLTRT